MATITITTPIRQANSLKRRVGCLMLLLIVVALATVGWWSVRRKGAAEASSSQPQWITPAIRNITTDVNATGTVKLKTGAEVRVGAQLSGIVRRLNVTVGSHVNQGDRRDRFAGDLGKDRSGPRASGTVGSISG